MQSLFSQLNLIELTLMAGFVVQCHIFLKDHDTEDWNNGC